MGKQAHDDMTTLETTTETTPPVRPRRRPGPKPRGTAHLSNGHGAVAPVSAVVALKHELSATEAQAGRLRRALQALEA